MTQTSTTGRGPRGWDRLVAQINGSPDLATFHRGMLDLQCKIVAAEYGALWIPGPEGKLIAAEAWPMKLAEMPLDTPLMQLLHQAAKSGFERQASHILKAEPEATADTSELGAHVFVTVLRLKGQVVAVTTVVAESRDATVLQSTAPLRELAAGLYEGFVARQEATRREAEATRVRQAMAILAVSQEAEGFGGACMNLVNELARQLKCMRVSLGWARGKGVKLKAMSDTEHIKRHSQDVSDLEMAMAECLDQQQPVAFPVPPGAEPLLEQAVIHAHRKMVGTSGRHVLSIPLRQRDEWLGVLVFERAEGPLDTPFIQFAQLIGDVVAPHLVDRKHGAQWLHVHAWRDIEKGSGYLIGPKHVGWKLGAVGIAALLVFCLVGTWNYRVSAPFVLEALDREILPAPFEAQLKSVNKEPGDHVEQGETLAVLDSTELKLQLEESRARFRLAKITYEQNQYDPDTTKLAEALEAKADMDKEQAHIDLLQYQIDHATIRSPLTGVLISGAWKDKVGSVVKQGDQMFEVSSLNDLVAVVHVSETDINQVKPGVEYTGEVATRSDPEQKFSIHVAPHDIVPAATPVNNVNSFEVRAHLDHGADWLRPGMEGTAKIEIGSKSIFWIVTHRITDTVRLWVWM